MSDPFVLLRNELLAQKPSLCKYLGRKKLSVHSKLADNVLDHPKFFNCQYEPTDCQRENRSYEGYHKINPEDVENEVNVYKHRGKMHKKVFYGPNDAFLIHKGLNPPNKYCVTLCPDKVQEFGSKKDCTLTARTAKAREMFVQRNILSDESEARRDTLKNMESYKSVVVDDLVKGKRAKTHLILKNSEKALIDQEEEMHDFYSRVGSSQVLAVRELQIQDQKHFREIGLDSKEIFFKNHNGEDGTTCSEYEEMLAHRNSMQEKKLKIVDVLKNQISEKDKMRDLEFKNDLENGRRLIALAEAKSKKILDEKDVMDYNRQKHFETFKNIADYRDYVRQVRVAEDEALLQRENDFLEEKAKFNLAWQDKQNEIKAEKERVAIAVMTNLRSLFEKQEEQDAEYYYTLQKEKDLKMQDQEIQEKLDKKATMEALMADWSRITEANRKIKEIEVQKENEERVRMMEFLEVENNAKKAEERKRMVEKDISRMEIMCQMNEREQRRQREMEDKAKELRFLRAEGFVRDGKIRNRMAERLEDFKRNGLSERMVSNIKKRYDLT